MLFEHVLQDRDVPFAPNCLSLPIPLSRMPRRREVVLLRPQDQHIVHGACQVHLFIAETRQESSMIHSASPQSRPEVIVA